MKVKYMKAESAKELNIDDYPNFSITGNITGMKRIYKNTAQYHQNNEQVLLVRSAGYIYHVPEFIYNKAY